MARARVSFRAKKEPAHLRLHPFGLIPTYKANLVGLAHLFKRPANARIARQARAAIGRPFKGGDDDGHRGRDCRFRIRASAVIGR
jgi:hypothetical protein